MRRKYGETLDDYNNRKKAAALIDFRDIVSKYKAENNSCIILTKENRIWVKNENPHSTWSFPFDWCADELLRMQQAGEVVRVNTCEWRVVKSEAI